MQKEITLVEMKDGTYGIEQANSFDISGAVPQGEGFKVFGFWLIGAAVAIPWIMGYLTEIGILP